MLATHADAWARTHLNLPLEFVPLDVADLVHRTPLQAWYTQGVWLQHPDPYQVLQ